ncbi:MAG: hypothetical protein HYX32_08865 [Actinobacteria bacterium]|nr:hypothetical protein [Actinomycetota bacterium]
MSPAAPRAASGRPTHDKITRDDLESKFRELQGEVEVVSEEAMNKVLVVGAVVVAAVVIVAFALGRRRGNKRRTVVEIRRI